MSIWKDFPLISKAFRERRFSHLSERSNRLKPMFFAMRTPRKAQAAYAVASERGDIMRFDLAGQINLKFGFREPLSHF
jgi:hypothetical protein